MFRIIEDLSALPFPAGPYLFLRMFLNYEKFLDGGHS